MDVDRFDHFARRFSRFASRRALVRAAALSGLGTALGLAGIVLGPDLDEIDAKSKKKRRKQRRKQHQKRRKKRRQQCNNRKPCQAPLNPCQTVSCVDHSCQTDNRPNGTSCGTGQVCAGGACVAACGAGTFCSGQTTCCANACVNTQSSLDHCGGCGNACDPDVADTCAGGACRCGNGAACSGGQVCDSGTCVCPDSGTCIVTPSSLGGWVVGAEGVTFVAGPDTPPSGTGSVELSTTNGLPRATFRFPGLAGVPIADIDTLSYSTYMQDGSSTGVVVPAIKLPVLYSNGTTFTTLIFEPTYTVGSDVEPDEWQTWDLLSANARWWSSRALPNDICAFGCFVPWEEILEAIPDAFINPDGLLIETGSGTPDAVGNADELQVNDVTFDFEPD